jgi:hypothetical protein
MGLAYLQIGEFDAWRYVACVQCPRGDDIKHGEKTLDYERRRWQAGAMAPCACRVPLVGVYLAFFGNEDLHSPWRY